MSLDFNGMTNIVKRSNDPVILISETWISEEEEINEYCEVEQLAFFNFDCPICKDTSSEIDDGYINHCNTCGCDIMFIDDGFIDYSERKKLNAIVDEHNLSFPTIYEKSIAEQIQFCVEKYLVSFDKNDLDDIDSLRIELIDLRK